MSQKLTIINVGGEHRIDSRLVAQSLGIEHESLIKTLRTYQTELEQLGLIRFEIGVKSGALPRRACE